MVMLSGLSMLYQMQRFPLFCATTTSLPGTHWTYEQKLSSVDFTPLFMSYSWSWGGGDGDRHWCSSLSFSSAPAEVREAARKPQDASAA